MFTANKKKICLLMRENLLLFHPHRELGQYKSGARRPSSACSLPAKVLNGTGTEPKWQSSGSFMLPSVWTQIIFSVLRVRTASDHRHVLYDWMDINLTKPADPVIDTGLTWTLPCNSHPAPPLVFVQLRFLSLVVPQSGKIMTSFFISLTLPWRRQLL